MVRKCEEAIVQFIVRTYDDDGRPVQEQASQQTKVFRANAPDVWAEIDEAISKESK